MCFSIIVITDRYAQYYVNQSGGCEIGIVYRARFMMQRSNGMWSFFKGLSVS